MHIGEIDKSVKQKIALEMSNAYRENGKVNGIVDEWAKKLNRSRGTIHRYARDNGFRTGRKKRGDAFQVSPELEGHLINILYIYHRKSRKNGSESGMPFETAVEVYRDHMLSLGQEIKLPSISRMQQITRRWKVSRRQAKEPTPHVDLVSHYPNHCHQIDFSICRYYMEPDGKIKYLKKSQDYKNKVGDFSKKQRLVRMVLIDHATGAFFVEYFFNQRIEEIAEFLYHGWSNKADDFIFHGVPDMLIMDNDKALHSHALMRLFKYLDVKIPEVEVEAARVKGTVEGFMRIWENWFEMKLLFQKPTSLEEINAWAYREAIRIQQDRIHRRHKMTRFAAWDEYIENHLRELPDKEIYEQMLYSKPVSRLVQRGGKLEFRGVEYKVTDKELYGFKVSVIVHPYLYQEDGTITIQFPEEGASLENIPFLNVKTYLLAPEVNSNFGFSGTGVVWGEYEKGKKKTESQKNFEKIEKAELTGHEIKPFSDAPAHQAGIFPPRIGKKIVAEPDYKAGPVPMSKFKGKQFLAQLLGRHLSPADLEAFENRFRERTVFEADVEALAGSLQPEKQAKEA